MPALPARGVSTGAVLPSFASYSSRSCSLVGGLSRLRQRPAKAREVTSREVRGSGSAPARGAAMWLESAAGALGGAPAPCKAAPLLVHPAAARQHKTPARPRQGPAAARRAPRDRFPSPRRRW